MWNLNKGSRECFIYLSHGTRRTRPHLLRLLELGAQIGRSLCRLGVGRSHLYTTDQWNENSAS